MTAVDEERSHAAEDIGVERVIRRLERRREAIEGKYETLVDRYGSAESMSGEVQAVIEAYERGQAVLRAASLEALSREVGAWIEDKGWADQRRYRCGFRTGFVEGPEGEEVLELESLAEELVPMGEVKTDQGEGVTYPIIFSHQEEENLRVAQMEVMWMAVIRWCERRLLEEALDSEIVLEDGERQVVVERQGPKEGAAPGAEELGWRHEGEIDGRLERFVQRDPGAHWRWMEEKRQAGQEQRFRMRDHRGAVVEIACQPQWKRLKIRWREATGVFRHRRDVFAQVASWRRQDWVVADAQALEGIWSRQTQQWIDDGYRLVEVEEA